jgi:hypothetical protein
MKTSMREPLTLTRAAFRPKHLMGLGLALCALSLQAQGLPDDPDWKETEVPAPPAFSTVHLIAVEMPSYVSLKFGVDPATLTITPDGIVRYVMVAVSASGSVNAMFEGIRCSKGEVKTYARTTSNGAWSVIKEPTWRDLSDNLPSKHAIAFARQGACDGRAAAASSVADIIRQLKR